MAFDAHGNFSYTTVATPPAVSNSGVITITVATIRIEKRDVDPILGERRAIGPMVLPQDFRA